MKANVALAKVILEKAHGSQILELGAEQGVSSLVLAFICSKTGGKFTTIDSWEGHDDFYEVCKDNLKDYDVNIIRRDLFDYSFPEPNIFDVIYFDACYSYPECKQMIERYLPYLKSDGLMIGHGADFWWSKCSPELEDKLRDWAGRVKSPEIVFPISDEFVKSWASKEYWQGYLPTDKEMKYIKVHVGLALSLYELFHDEYEIVPDDTLWWRYK